MSETIKRTHKFHSEAKVLEGDLRLPLVQRIHPQAHAQLAEEGGYRAQHATGYRLEGVVSYSAAHSQVAGQPGVKPGHGWCTLTTTVLENLNILEVLTADRIVGQIITEHPLEGYVPHIHFLGTRFDNLRIAGHRVELELDTNILGDKPADDAPYTKDEGVVGRVSSQYERIRKHKSLPAELAERYNRLASTLKNPEAVECSLVNQAAGPYPGHSFGHVITIPGFGTITLGKLVVTHEDYDKKTGIPKKTTVQLTMVDLKLGCAIQGEMMMAVHVSNGTSWP
jgi:hypothetical protein